MATTRVQQFVDSLRSHRSEREFEKIQRYFKADDPDNQVIGVRMKTVFDLAEEYRDLFSLHEIEALLESPFYEARMGAVSVMDFRARLKSTAEDQRKALYDLYLRRHDRINNWDLVDRAAPRVIGGYLYEFDQPRRVLRKLAQSTNPWERRTAIVCTAYFIRHDEVDDTFALAELLLSDEHELVQKAVGSWVREAGKRDEVRFRRFLDDHASRMPRETLNAAIKNLEPDERNHYRSAQKLS